MTADEFLATGPMRPDVLLIAADWQSRVLTLAELQETGYDVAAAPGLRVALNALAHHRISPALVLLDAAGDEEAAPARVEDVMALAPGVPVVLVIGALDRAAWEPLRAEVAALFVRPVTVGALVEAVQRIAPPRGEEGYHVED